MAPDTAQRGSASTVVAPQHGLGASQQEEALSPSLQIRLAVKTLKGRSCGGTEDRPPWP